MLLFIEATPPKLSPLIEIVIEEPQEEAPETPLYTLEEQIKLDINNCEPERYISAEDASCLAKPVVTQVSTQKPVRTAVNSSQAPSGWYPYGQCTYLVWSERPVGQWNNASQWYSQAQRDGWATGLEPAVGAIAWEPNHVSLVVAVNNDGTIKVKEMNYVGLGVVSYRTAPASQFKFIY